MVAHKKTCHQIIGEMSLLQLHLLVTGGGTKSVWNKNNSTVSTLRRLPQRLHPPKKTRPHSNHISWSLEITQ